MELKRKRDDKEREMATELLVSTGTATNHCVGMKTHHWQLMLVVCDWW